jgi:multiple sugar transport system substrate-binding protein
LLHPFDDLIPAGDDPDWFPYARQLARLQDSIFGIPFAGDALVLVYRTSDSFPPPRTLEDAQAQGGPLAFSAADPQALFTLALYQAAGGTFLDEEGRPTLDTAILTRVLAYYQQAATSGFAPVWLTQIETPGQAWESFMAEQAPMVVTWASNYLAELPANTAASAPPTLDGEPFSLANGWVWALASPNPEHQRLSVELAQYLSESSFLAKWTAESGYLPPRPSALDAWQASPQKDLAIQVTGPARLIPSTDVQASISPLLEEAALQVLKQQMDAETAAQNAVTALSAP